MLYQKHWRKSCRFCLLVECRSLWGLQDARLGLRNLSEKPILQTGLFIFAKPFRIKLLY
jgi:hypothetical protein